MRAEILTAEQKKLLPLVAKFSPNFGLVGGTAIALHIGHRTSIDFDLFSLKEFQNKNVRKKITDFTKIENIIRDEDGQYTLLAGGVRFTFFYYPFEIKFSDQFEDVIMLPDLLTLSAMKAYALGRRAKWKDYVDLYFVMKDFFGLKEIAAKSKEIFGTEFNEKLFREQLCYFKGIDYSESVDFLKGFKVSDDVIKRKLKEFSLV